MTSERPKKLSKVELEQYNVLLEEQAFPFEEKATELHEVNAHRAASGVYDKWVKSSFDALARAAPGALRQGRSAAKESSMRSASVAVRLGALAAACSAAAGCATVSEPLQRRARRGHAAQPRRRSATPAAGSAPAAPARRARRAAGLRHAGQPGDAARLRRRQPGRCAAAASTRPSGASKALAQANPELRRTARQPRRHLSPGRQGQRGGRRARAGGQAQPAPADLPEPARHRLPPAGPVRQVARRLRERARPRSRATPRRCSTWASCTTSICDDGARALELYGRYLLLQPSGDATVTKWVADLKNRKPAPITVSRQEKP